MKNIIFYGFLTVLLGACEPRDLQVMRSDEVRQQGRGSTSGSSGGNQIFWEKNFDTVSSLMLSSELLRISAFQDIINQSIEGQLGDPALPCLQVSSIPISEHKHQGSLQFVNCYFSGETSVSLSGTLHFAKELVGIGQVPHYRLRTSGESPLFYKIRGNRKLISLKYDLNLEFSVVENLIETQQYVSHYHWVNSLGQEQSIRIDGLVKPSISAGSLLGFLSYSSRLAEKSGPFFDLNLESQALPTTQRRLNALWCQESSSTFKLRFDYKPSMRRSNAELRASSRDILIKSTNPAREPDRDLQVESVCKLKWSSSKLSWIVNPALLFIE